MRPGRPSEASAAGGISAPLADLIRHWGVYCLGSVSGRLASFVLLPIYTRFLSPADYGIKALVMLAADFVGLFLGLGLAAAVTRFYWSDRNGAPRPEAVSTGLLLSVGIFGIGVAGALWWSSPLAALVFGDPAYTPYLRLGLVGLFFNNAIVIPMTYLQIRKRSGAFILTSIGILLTSVLLNVLFVVFLGWGVNGVLYSDILTYAVFFPPLVAVVAREVGWRFSLPLAGTMLRYGGPLTLLPLAWIVMNRADLRFLTHYGSLSAVGIYSVAGQLALILLAAVIQPFETAWGPGQFELDRQENAAMLFRRIFQMFLSILLLLGLAVSVFADDLVRIMTAPDFWPAASVVPALIASYVLVGAAVVFRSGLLIANRTGAVAAIALVTAAVNLGVNAVLVPLYLGLGAALAKVAAALALVSLTYLVAQRVYPRDFRLGGAVKAVGCGVVLFVLSRYIPPAPWPLALGLKVVLVMALAPLCAWSHSWLGLRREGGLGGGLGSLDWRALVGSLSPRGS
jgi:O-antigen/teichoic acid export membrane protein